MKRRLISLLAAAAVGLTALAPAPALAQPGYHERGGDRYDRHGRYDDHRGHYDHRRRHYRDRDNDDEALAAGVIGLVLGVVIGAAASQPDQREARCYDNYQRCEPPPGYYDRSYDRYGYDQRYEGPQCTRRERQWDRYAQRYITVDVPC